MKKITALLLCLVMILSLAGCAGTVSAADLPKSGGSSSSSSDESSHPDYTPVFDFIENDAYRKFYDDIRNNPPASLEIVLDAAAGDRLTVTDTDSIIAMADELAKYSIGQKCEESVSDGNARSLTFIMGDGREFYFSFYYKYFFYNNDYYFMDSNGSELWTLAEEAKAVSVRPAGSETAPVEESESADENRDYDPYRAYEAVVASKLKEMENCSFAADYSRAALVNVDGSEYPQLFMAYTTDGKTLHAAIYRVNSDGKVMYYEIDLPELAGAATCSFYATSHGDIPCAALIFENYDGEKPFGTMDVYLLDNLTITPSGSGKFSSADEKKLMISQSGLELGDEICSFGENGTGMRFDAFAGYIFDPDEVQYAYNAIIDDILADMGKNISWKSSLDFFVQSSRGSISDFFGKHVNQMLICYTPDGQTLKAGIYITSRDGKMVSKTIDVSALAGGATCELIPGSYDGKDAVYVLYENYDGDKIIGNLYGYDVSGDTIKSVYSEAFEGMDGLKKLNENKLVYLGATACSFNANGTGKPLNSLQAQ